MGDIVLYDNLGQNPNRLWVPAKEVRYWLRFFRAGGRVALSLKQWKRQGMRPFPPAPKRRNLRAEIAHLADSARVEV